VGEDPEQLRAEIARTRAELGQDLDVLVEKVTPSKVVERKVDATKEAVAGVKEKIMGSAASAKDSVMGSSGHSGGPVTSTSTSSGGVTSGLAGSLSGTVSGVGSTVGSAGHSLTGAASGAGQSVAGRLRRGEGRQGAAAPGGV